MGLFGWLVGLGTFPVVFGIIVGVLLEYCVNDSNNKDWVMAGIGTGFKAGSLITFSFLGILSICGAFLLVLMSLQ